MHDSTDTFDMVTTHPIQIGNRYRRVNCIRDPREPIDKCPLCNSGSKIQQRIYIYLIQYVRDENGNLILQGKVWERAANFAVTLKNLIDEYGPLSDSIFKIRRNGEAGNMKTTYSILYCNPNVYKNSDFPIDTSIFEGYNAIGNTVLDKSASEIEYFINNGDFPNNDSNNRNIEQISYSPAVTPETTYDTVTAYDVNTISGVINQASSGTQNNNNERHFVIPQDETTFANHRPIRYY